MNKEEIFSIWAPDGSPWSRWVKPVLFAHLDAASPEAQITEPAVDVGWAPAAAEKVAVIVNLPGSEGVFVGLALAAYGYRPVPLYNAVPLPFAARILDPLAGPAICAVDVLPIVSALKNGSEQLAQIALPPDAPPVFLLDANRAGGSRTMLPNEFDNRSIVFTTDFPSANFLQANGIGHALLVQRTLPQPPTDLAHVLRRWQDGGLMLEKFRVDIATAPERFEVARPSWYGAMFQRALAAIGLRRARSGGFGAWVLPAGG